MEKKELNLIQKILYILCPMAVYYLMTITFALSASIIMPTETSHFGIIVKPVTLLCLIGFFIKSYKPTFLKKDALRLWHVPVIILSGAALALLLNVAISTGTIFLLKQIVKEETITQLFNAATYDKQLPVIESILSHVIFTPLLEETLFRGITLQRTRDYYSDNASIIIVALLFGVFHMNPLQFLYAFIMGAVMTKMYIRYECLLPGILFHMAANGIIIFTQYLPIS